MHPRPYNPKPTRSHEGSEGSPLTFLYGVYKRFVGFYTKTLAEKYRGLNIANIIP